MYKYCEAQMKNLEQQNNMQSYYEDLQKFIEEAPLEEPSKWIKEVRGEDFEFNEQSFDELLVPVKTKTGRKESDSNSDTDNGIDSGMNRENNFDGGHLAESNFFALGRRARKY